MLKNHSYQDDIKLQDDDGLTIGDFHDSPQVHYHQLYYEAIDRIVSSLKDRFDQPGYGIYCKLEELLIKASCREDFKPSLDFFTGMIFIQIFCVPNL